MQLWFVDIEQAHISHISNTDIIAEGISFVDIGLLHQVSILYLVILPKSIFCFTFPLFYVLIVPERKSLSFTFVFETHTFKTRS